MRGLSIGVVFLYAALLLIHLPATGLTDDDDFYLPAGESYATWLLSTWKKSAWRQEAVDRAFDINHEHPPMAKYGLGLAGRVFGPVLGPIDGPRVSTVLASTLCAALLVLLAWTHLGRERGTFVGVASVLALASMPRFGFHSRVGTLDVPVAAAVLLAVSVALWGERSRWAARLAGVPFGVALATKLNAPFLLVPMALFWWITRPGRTESPDRRWLPPPKRRLIELKPLPTTFVSMVVLGPLVFLALWPWLWFDTADRFVEYVKFHLHHYPILFYYFGERYDRPFAPWHAPFVMAGLTTPVAVMALALAGLGLGIPALGRRILRRSWPRDAERDEGDLLWCTALNALFAVLPVALSGGPKYGGVKLFLPFFPFLALLAGYGALRLWELAKTLGRRETAACATALAVAFASAFAYQGAYSDRGLDGAYALSAYNGLARGVRGATAGGFERQYYDIAFRDQLRWLNDNAPENARIHFMPNHKEYRRTFGWWRKAGLLREDLRLTPSERSAHWVVLTHERRFPSYSSELSRLSQGEVLYTRWVQGAPLWTVYEGRRLGRGQSTIRNESLGDSSSGAR